MLGTFGLMLFFNDLTLTLWGPEPYFMAMPRFLSGAVPLIAGSRYPVYRLAITAAGLAVAALLYILIARMRLGMLIRAAASNREMLGGLGGNVRAVMIFVFGLGSALAGFAGVMAAPLVAVQVGMGDAMLIPPSSSIVIGGIGSVRGAFVSAILVGLGRHDGARAAARLARLYRRSGGRLDGDLSADGRRPAHPAHRHFLARRA